MEAEEKEEMEIGEGKVGLKEGAGQGKVGPGFLLVLGHPFGNLPQLSSQTRHSRVVFSQKRVGFCGCFPLRVELFVCSPKTNSEDKYTI